MCLLVDPNVDLGEFEQKTFWKVLILWTLERSLASPIMDMGRKWKPGWRKATGKVNMDSYNVEGGAIHVFRSTKEAKKYFSIRLPGSTAAYVLVKVTADSKDLVACLQKALREVG